MGDGHQSGGVAADADRARAALSRLPICSSSRRTCCRTTPSIRVRRSCCRRSPGREIRHRHQFGTADFAPARVSVRLRAKRDRTGGSVSEDREAAGFGAAFNYRSAAKIFREHAQLSGFENAGERAFDISGLAQMSDVAFDDLVPVTWPVQMGENVGRSRFFDNSHFFTSDNRACFIAPELPALKTKLSLARSLRLNTGRIHDQWHTMTRTGTSPRLAKHLPQPFVEVNPDDAASNDLIDGAFARVSNRLRRLHSQSCREPASRPGMLFAPIHWSDATASVARTGSLVAPFVDPISGRPAK